MEIATQLTDQQRYQKQYYQNNRPYLLQYRKEKYANDPEYRNAVKRRAMRWYNERKQEQAAIIRLKPGQPRMLGIYDDATGVVRTVRVYLINEVAAALGRTTKTLCLWEAKGILPKPTYHTAAKWRLYTEDQAKAIIECFRLARLQSAVKANPRLIVFQRLIHFRWKQMPKGLSHESPGAEAAESAGSGQE
jgi:hypothetical protein